MYIQMYKSNIYIYMYIHIFIHTMLIHNGNWIKGELVYSFIYMYIYLYVYIYTYIYNYHSKFPFTIM
jgi:hypothetical protein